MRQVTALILHPPAPDGARTPVRWLAAARDILAERHRAAFEAAGADHVRIVTEEGPAISFGERLRVLARDIVDATPAGRRQGIVVIGSGAMPLARPSDHEEFVRVARGYQRRPVALANSYYSADAVAVPDAAILLGLPDLPSDNALPRWLAERAGVPVRDRRNVWRLGIDIDSPLDVVLVAGDPGCPRPLRALAREIVAGSPELVGVLHGVMATLEDRRAELLVAGRSSSRTLRWLELRAACRVRAMIEERGLRSGTTMALGDLDDDRAEGPPVPAAAVRFRPPRSVLAMLLEESGPRLLTQVVGQLADAAIIDTRVLLAHRFGLDERRWPSLPDRLDSDLLRPTEIMDQWLRQITRRAIEARTPMLLGGHTLVGPGLPLLPGVVRWLHTPEEPEPEPEVGEVFETAAIPVQPAVGPRDPEAVMQASEITPALELRVQDEAELAARNVLPVEGEAAAPADRPIPGPGDVQQRLWDGA